MHSCSSKYTNIILLFLVTMMIIKLGSSLMKGNHIRKIQFHKYPLSSSLANINDKVYSCYYHSSSRLMMTATDSIDELNSNIQIAG